MIDRPYADEAAGRELALNVMIPFIFVLVPVVVSGLLTSPATILPGISCLGSYFGLAGLLWKGWKFIPALVLLGLAGLGFILAFIQTFGAI